MDKNAIKTHIEQIIAASNSVEVSGERNMAQIMGICMSAREIWRIVAKDENETAAGSPKNVD